MEEDSERKSTCKAMSPGSMNMPSMHNWDIGQSMSPYIPPDMSSECLEMQNGFKFVLYSCFRTGILLFVGIASGSMMTSGPPGFSVPNVSRANNYDTSNSSEYSSNGHCNILGDSLESLKLESLNVMEKNITDQVSKSD